MWSLRSVAVVGVVAVLSYGAGTRPPGPEMTTIPQGTRVDSFRVLVNTENSHLEVPIKQVIRDSATFAAMWPKVASPVTKAPAINFARDEVILVARGTQSSKGFGLIVDGITSGADSVTVDVTLLSPGEYCLEYVERTEPVVMVLHPRATPDRPVRFVEHHKTRRPCRPPTALR